MDIKKVFADIQNLNNLIYLINQRDKKAIAELNRLYALLYGETVIAGCSNCHIKAFRKLTALSILDLKTMAEQKFKIKKGVLVEYPYPGTFYSSESGIPDAVAVQFLKKFPAKMDQFDRIPGDLDSLLKGSAAKPVAATAKDKKATQVKADEAPLVDAEDTKDVKNEELDILE